MTKTKNREAEAAAFRSLKSKFQTIKEFNIDKLSKSDLKALINERAAIKSAAEGRDLEDTIKGQEFYINGLVEVAKLRKAGKIEEALDLEYAEKLAEYGTHDDFITELESI